MIGVDSGLSSETLKELEHWQGMFNWEAHGGVYTAVAEGDDWRTGKGPLPLVPALQ